MFLSDRTDKVVFSPHTVGNVYIVGILAVVAGKGVPGDMLFSPIMMQRLKVGNHTQHKRMLFLCFVGFTGAIVYSLSSILIESRK